MDQERSLTRDLIKPASTLNLGFQSLELTEDKMSTTKVTKSVVLIYLGWNWATLGSVQSFYALGFPLSLVKRPHVVLDMN